MSEEELTIWTVGHSTRTLGEFIELLTVNDIEVLADVRRFPASRKHPHFDQDALRTSLQGVGVEYVTLPELGGRRRPRPDWVKPIVQALYFTGMRRGEALGLTWENISLESRIIRLHAHQTQERQSKRVPIHRLLVPIFHQVSRVRSISTDRVFLTDRGKPPSPDSLKKPWKLAIEAVGLDPAPTIHDLRHVWKTNAMRSGLDFEMREAILGHSRGVAGRYGRISDDDLVRAVNGMRFDVGQTEIWVARKEKENPRRVVLGKNSNSTVTESMIPPSQEKWGCL